MSAPKEAYAQTLVNKVKSFIGLKTSQVKLSKDNGPKNALSPKESQNFRAKYKGSLKPKRVVSYQIEDVRAALTSAMNPARPDRTKLLAVYDYIFWFDGHLFSQIRTARFKVTGRQYGLYKNDVLDKELTKIIEKQWFENLIEFIIDREFYGFTAVEIMVDKTTGKVDVDMIPRENINPDYGWILLEGTLDGKVIPIVGNELITNVLLFYDRGEFGILHVSAPNSIYKFYDRGDWSRFNEKYGIPVLKMTVNSNLDTELDNAEAKAASFGSDGYLVLQGGDDAEIMDRPQFGHNTFKDGIQLDDDENSKIVNGQTATAEEKSFVGSAEVQERILQDYSYVRMRSSKNIINDQVLPFLRAKGIAIPEDVYFDFALLNELKNRPALETNATPSAAPEPTPKPGTKTKQSKVF